MLTPTQAYRDLTLEAPVVDAKVEYQLADSTDWVDLLDGSTRLLESGSVSLSRQSNVQRTASIAVGGSDAFPTSWTHPCAPINRFRLYRGIRIWPNDPASVEWLRVGTFVVTSQKKSRPKNLCSFQLSDYMQAVAGDNLNVPVETTEGTPVYFYIRRLLIDTDTDLPNVVVPEVEPSFPGSTLIVEPGVNTGMLLTDSPVFDGSRGDALDYLTQLMEATLYANVDGDFVLTPRATTITANTPVFTFQSGDGGSYSEIDTDIDFSTFCNAVSIRNGDFVVEASITEGPLRVRSGFTYRYVEDVSNQAWSAETTSEYAARVIAEKLGVAEQVSATIPALAWLEGGDPVQIDYPDGTSAQHRIDQISFPLGALGSSSMTTRTLQTVSIVAPATSRSDGTTPTPDIPVISDTFTGTETVTIAAPSVGDVAFLAVRPDATAVSGGFASWSLVYDGSTDTPGVSLWVGRGVGAGTTVTISGGASTGYSAIAVVSDITGTLSLLDAQVSVATAPTTPAPGDTAALAVGDVALCVVRGTGGYAPAAESGIVEAGFVGLRARSVAPSGTAEGIALTVGTATATSVSATFPMTGSAGSATVLTVGLRRTAPVPVVIPPGGVSVTTSDNLVALVNGAPAGTIFYLEAGTHRISTTLTPRRGVQLIGPAGGSAKIDGSIVLSSWTSASSRWYAPATFGARDATMRDGTYSVCDISAVDGTDLCWDREQVWRDDVRMTRVASLAAGDAGSGERFFQDRVNNRIYIWSNPSGHTIEMNKTAIAIESAASSIVLRGITVQKFATPLQQGAVHVNGGDSWTIDGCYLSKNHALGLYTTNATNLRHTGGEVSENGQLGVGAAGKASTTFSGNLWWGVLFDANNQEDFYIGDWESGGFKTSASAGGKVKDCVFTNNKGLDLWTDSSASNWIFEGNSCTNAYGAAIRIEISSNISVRRNTIVHSGHDIGAHYEDAHPTQWRTVMDTAGVSVSASSYVEIFENTVDTTSLNGIIANINSRTTVSASGGDHISIHDNTVTQRQTPIEVGPPASSTIGTYVAGGVCLNSAPHALSYYTAATSWTMPAIGGDLGSRRVNTRLVDVANNHYLVGDLFTTKRFVYGAYVYMTAGAYVVANGPDGTDIVV